MKNVSLHCVLKDFFAFVESWVQSSLSGEAQVLLLLGVVS